MDSDRQDRFAGLCERDRLNGIRLLRWFGIFSLLLVIVSLTMGPMEGGISMIPTWRYVLVALTLIPAVFTLKAYLRFIGNADELLKQVHLEAASRSFIVVIFAGYLYILATQLFGEWSDSGAILWFIGFLTYIVNIRRAWGRLNV